MDANTSALTTPDLRNEMAQRSDESSSFVDRALEKNWLPDFVIPFGIRHLLARRLREENKGGVEAQQRHLLALVDELKRSPIAIETRAANAQHYEVPTQFYQCCLGKKLKYSGAFWPDDVKTLDAAEEAKNLDYNQQKKYHEASQSNSFFRCRNVSIRKNSRARR